MALAFLICILAPTLFTDLGQPLKLRLVNNRNAELLGFLELATRFFTGQNVAGHL